MIVGTKVTWPNNDEIYHNVFSLSDAKQFDLGLYKERAKEVLFDELGHRDAEREWGRTLNRASIGAIWSLLAGFPPDAVVVVVVLQVSSFAKV